jgi:hypothetical protein
MPVRTVSVPKRGWVSRPKPATTRPSVGHGSWPAPAQSDAGRGGRARATARWAGARRARLRTRASGRAASVSPRQALVRGAILPGLASSAPRSACRDLRPPVSTAPELDELRAPAPQLLSRRQAVGGGVSRAGPDHRGDSAGRSDRALTRQGRRPAAQGGPAALPRAGRACRVCRERGLLAHEVFHHTISPASRASSPLDLDDARSSCWSAPALGEGDRCPSSARSEISPPRRRGALAARRAGGALAERLLLGLEGLTAGRRRTGARAGREPGVEAGSEHEQKTGGTVGDRLTFARSGAAGREGADQPERRPTAGQVASQEGGRRRDRAPGPRGASPVQGARARRGAAPRAEERAERRQTTLARAPPGGAPHAGEAQDAHLRGACPPRGQVARRPPRAPRARGRRRGRGPEAKPAASRSRAPPAEGRLHLGHPRQSIERLDDA